MEIVGAVKWPVIEQHLIDLGAGNHKDNVENLRPFPNFYQIELAKEEFLNLVFLAIPTLEPIVPKYEDRRLIAVAKRAVNAMAEGANVNYDNNWNLEVLIKIFNEKYNHEGQIILPELVIRDTRNSEKYFNAEWYIQDGCHRALAYAIAIEKGDLSYSPQKVYCATRISL